MSDIVDLILSARLDQWWVADRSVFEWSPRVALGVRPTRWLYLRTALDSEYLVGRAGVETIGQPRMIYAGLRASRRSRR